MSRKKLKIAMLSAEAAPFAKVGGLGDVVGSLPKALARLGCDVRILVPLYGSINRKKFAIEKLVSGIAINAGGREKKIDIWAGKLPESSVPVYFVQEPSYFGGPDIYATSGNSERFLFFSLASICALPHIGFSPDIIHCHDFHTAMAIDIVKSAPMGYLKNTKTMFTIHNLKFQGKTREEILENGGLTSNSLLSLKQDLKDGDVNFMVQAIINSDIVTTVSANYAEEIGTAAYGEGLEKIIRRNKSKIFGILNGIDTGHFDPSQDSHIKQNYNRKSIGEKIINKLFIQKKVGLPVGKKPLVAFVGRLDPQKGIDLIAESLIKDADAQFIFLGTGLPEYENYLSCLHAKFPDKISLNLKFDLKLAQLIYAGADILLIPSLYEPCGLTQMIAMRYGTVPVARKTGGLADTVLNLEHRPKSDGGRKSKIEGQIRKSLFGIRRFKSTGFTFDEFSANALSDALNRALQIYYNYPEIWRRLQANGMQEDFSWNKPAKKYLKLYRKLMRAP